MATTVDPSKSSLALAVRLGIAKEGEPITPLMSMLTTMKDYADNVDIGALTGTQASWAACIPHAEKLLELERKALEELRAKAVEWDSKISSRTGELAELDAKFETMTQETARAGEQLLDANRKQSEATKQLARTLERTRTAEESHAKDEERLKVKEDLLSTYNDQLEKREASSASKEACLKHRREELEAGESKMAATQKHARESDSQAQEHLNAIRNAHLTLSMLTEKTGLPTTKLSAHELVDSLQSLTSNIQDQLGHLKDQITHLNQSHKTEEEEQAKAHLIGDRVLKELRDDVAAKASQIKKAELGAADYRRKFQSLQATSSQRIHELELSNNSFSITNNSLEERLQNHNEMVAEYAKYKALERSEKTLSNRIQYTEKRLQGVERQRNDCVAANRKFEIENARLQKFEQAHLLDQKELEQYMHDRDTEMGELRVEVELSKAEARRLAEHCEDLKSQAVTNAENAATDIDRLQAAHRDEVSRTGQDSDAKILELDEIVKRQEEQLKDAEKLATEQEDSLRKAEDLSTSLYKTIKDGASAIDSANKCRMEHHDFDDLKRRVEIERSSRARRDDRQADIRIIKTLKGQQAASHHEIRRLRRMNLEEIGINAQTIKISDGRIAQLELEKTNAQRIDVQTIEALRGENANLRTEIERLNRTISEERGTNAQTIKTLEGRITQWELEKAEDRKMTDQTILTLRGENADSQTKVERLNRIISEERGINAQTIKTLEGRIAQSELEKTEDQRTIGALRSQNADSQTEVGRLNGMVTKYESKISEYTKANSETVKELKGQFDQHVARIRELETAEAEATNRATTADHKLRTYEKTITRLRSERDDAREELELATATHATALEDVREELESAKAAHATALDGARHELESLQERATPDNQNGQPVNKRAKRKRTAAEMLEDDVPGHAFDLQQIRDPDFEDPNIPGDILDKLHQQFDRWDQKSQEWTRQPTKSRCVETRCAKISSKHLHGNEYACDHCEERGRVCVVIRRAGIVNLLPVHQDGEAVGPDDEGYWTK